MISKFEVLTSQEPFRWSPGTCGDPQELSGFQAVNCCISILTKFNGKPSKEVAATSFKLRLV